MEFALTSELSRAIVFSMEDQTGLYVLDSEKTALVPSGEVTNHDPDRYYSLPVWDSISGFRLMERFVSSVKSPLIREKLRAVLRAGHGVFRNFKNVLKEYPEAEKLWFSFKEHEMNRVVLCWYEDLRDVWGLERLGEEPEENEELVHDDFSFRPFVKTDMQTVGACINGLAKEAESDYGSELGGAFAALLRTRFEHFASGAQNAVVCESVSGDFAGFVAAVPSPVTESVQYVSPLFVVPRYRGLGIGKELLGRCLDALCARHVHFAVVSDTVMPDFFKNILVREGFTFLGSVFYLDLSKRQK